MYEVTTVFLLRYCGSALYLCLSVCLPGSLAGWLAGWLSVPVCVSVLSLSRYMLVFVFFWTVGESMGTAPRPTVLAPAPSPSLPLSPSPSRSMFLSLSLSLSLSLTRLLPSSHFRISPG